MDVGEGSLITGTGSEQKNIAEKNYVLENVYRFLKVFFWFSVYEELQLALQTQEWRSSHPLALTLHDLAVP